MGAAKGNQYALGSKESGRPRAFETSEQWREAIDRYFDWADANPLMKNEALKSGIDAGRIIQIPTQQPYLIEELCNYLEISVQTFHNYENAEGYEEYFEVSAYARNRVFAQNLKYGYVGAFDAGLVARKLGIADKQEVKNNIESGKLSINIAGFDLNLSAGLEVREPKTDV